MENFAAQKEQASDASSLLVEQEGHVLRPLRPPGHPFKQEVRK